MNAKYLPIIIATVVVACGPPDPVVETSAIRVEVDEQMHTRVSERTADGWSALTDFQASETVTVDGAVISDFALESVSKKRVTGKEGKGSALVLTGTANGLTKTLTITTYADFPSIAVTDVRYTNTSGADVTVSKWVNNAYTLANTTPEDNENRFWSYQSGSYISRPDWVLPVNVGFEQANYMGMNNSDYGGGTPVSSLWRPDGGLAVGHLELVPKLVSVPVSMPDASGATLHIEYENDQVLKAGESLSTFTTFVRVQEADYFASLVDYHNIMVARGIEFPEIRPSAYETQWCAWGYERTFTMEQVYNTLPAVKNMGYKWAVLDDGWQTNVGDWALNPEKYPTGDADMIKFVNTLKDEGFRPKLWWAPLAVHPSSDLYKEHEDHLLLDEEGNPQFITWWNAYYLCPAYQPVVDYHTDLVSEMMETWGYEGIKIDGQHLNGAAACYNPKHNHARPEESVEAMPTFFKAIHDRATSIVDDALIEICPCGTAYAFHLLPYMTQGVSSDPTSSWQVRHKGRTLKALMGRSTPFYGDHVELTRGGTDFASQIGIGAVIGTKFTWPVGAGPDPDTDLTPEREAYWTKWSNIYQSTRLAEGEYIGELYDIGFDRPEAHVVRKDNAMHYAFYADQAQGRNVADIGSFSGSVELRGLEAGKTYSIVDYENNVDYGNVTGPTARIDVAFTNHILLKATPN
jgi:alpha-galactosidase